MNDRRESNQAHYSSLERELAVVLLKISDTTERIARNLMILKAQRKMKGVNSDEKE